MVSNPSPANISMTDIPSVKPSDFPSEASGPYWEKAIAPEVTAIDQVYAACFGNSQTDGVTTRQSKAAKQSAYST
tara:strand:+ start:32 stop:256 length:225 start_codon:yes stop_codon:yes gene_type:complete